MLHYVTDNITLRCFEAVCGGVFDLTCNKEASIYFYLTYIDQDKQNR
jgi:hypothetical protein